MSIRGVTFDNQLVSAKDFGALFAGILEDGILKGCMMAHTSNTLTIAAGYVILSGRLIRLTSPQTIETSASGKVARVLIEIDLSGEATTEDFSQVNLGVQYAENISALPELIKNDVNGIGQKYQMELCVMQLTQGNIDEIVRQKTVAPAVGVAAAQALATADAALPKTGGTVTGTLTQQGMFKLGGVNYGNTLPEPGNPGRIFFKKV